MKDKCNPVRYKNYEFPSIIKISLSFDKNVTVKLDYAAYII
ncbi:hypothetical protein [Oceanirhabdus seepicola]|nr:hypothetical protein [Oceanirhabdus seepicola]